MKNSFTKNFLTSLFDSNSISTILMKEKQDGPAVVGVWHSIATLAFADPDGCVRLTPAIAMDVDSIAEYFHFPVALVQKSVAWLKRLDKLCEVDGNLKFTAAGSAKKDLSPERIEHLHELNRIRVARCRKRKKENERKQTGNASVMESVMLPVTHPVTDGEKTAETFMDTASETMVTEPCNASVMPVMDPGAEKRKKQRKENIYNSYSLPACEPAKTSAEKDVMLPVEKLPAPLRSIVDVWNRLGVNGVTAVSSSLQEKMRALLSRYNGETISGAIAGIAKSAFLLGKKNNSRWSVTLGWLMNPDNFAKVLSGKYLDKPRVTNETDCGTDDRRAYYSEPRNNIPWGARHRLPFYLPGEGDEPMSDEEYEAALYAMLHPTNASLERAERLLRPCA